MRAKPLFFRRTVRSPIVPLRGAVALALSLACALSAFAQKSSNWRVYRLADGLPDASCFSITLAPHSKVLVRHLKTPFATELDGYGIRVLPLMGDQGASRVYQSPAGQMWTTWSQGLLEYKGGG